MSAILIAKFTIKDPDKYKEYAGKARETWMSAGAEALFRTRSVKITTGGEPDHEIAVIFKFPSLKAIHDWYDSDAYRPLHALHAEGAEFQMTSYEILD